LDFKMMNSRIVFADKQRGVVLFISLIMLVVIGMLSLSLMGMARVEMRMANNEEARISALQMAQAINDIIVSDPDKTPVVGGAGYKMCASDHEGCDEVMTDLPVNSITTAINDGHLTATATRADPEFRPPPRGMGFSASKFVGTSFRLRATYDRTEDGQGYGAVEEGLIVLIPL
jgi:hypothetical protein